jgi:glycosyltransferase involved in cell wall biosynthesis
MYGLKKKRVHIFLRKPVKSINHSIEKLFHKIAKEKSDEFKFVFLKCPFYSKGILRRFFNCIWALCNQGDINHISGDVNFISLFLNKSKTINTFHDCYHLKYLTGLKKIIYKFFWYSMPIKKSKYITTISNFTKYELKKNIKTDRKIAVIKNFSTINSCVINKSKKKHFFIVIGTTDNKNLDRILSAVKNLKFKLVIVGYLNSSQKEFIKKNRIKHKNFINVSEAKIIQLYSQSLVLINPSLYEGFGLTNLEAQAMGVPVLTSNISPIKSIMGKSAILVNPYNVNEIHKKWRIFLNQINSSLPL